MPVKGSFDPLLLTVWKLRESLSGKPSSFKKRCAFAFILYPVSVPRVQQQTNHEPLIGKYCFYIILFNCVLCGPHRIALVPRYSFLFFCFFFVINAFVEQTNNSLCRCIPSLSRLHVTSTAELERRSHQLIRPNYHQYVFPHTNLISVLLKF